MALMDSRNLIEAHARQTLDKLSELELVPSPTNYELFFTYISGKNVALNQDLDRFFESGSMIDEEVAAQLHTQHCRDQTASEVIESTSSDLVKEMSGVQSFLETASQDTNAYGNALEGVNHAITKRGNSSIEVSRIVEKVITATKAMEEKTRKLEHDLESSSNEIYRLRESLIESQREALTDSLTRLANRKHFDKKLQEAVREVYETGEAMSVLMSDVDYFKKFNDTWGHLAGDQILRLIGKCMKENIKGRDTAARYGGEEFAVIFPNTALEGALSVAEQIRTAVERKKIIKKSTGESLGRVTMSFGVAQYRSGEQLSDLITRADKALYAAKEAGRNVVLGEHEIPEPKGKETKTA